MKYEQHQTQITFGPGARMDEVGQTLTLARIAAGTLCGSERVELEAPAHLDADHRSVRIDTRTEAGRTLSAIFLGYCRREFGPDAVRVAGCSAEGAVP